MRKLTTTLAVATVAMVMFNLGGCDNSTPDTTGDAYVNPSSSGGEIDAGTKPDGKRALGESCSDGTPCHDGLECRTDTGPKLCHAIKDTKPDTPTINDPLITDIGTWGLCDGVWVRGVGYEDAKMSHKLADGATEYEYRFLNPGGMLKDFKFRVSLGELTRHDDNGFEWCKKDFSKKLGLKYCIGYWKKAPDKECFGNSKSVYHDATQCMYTKRMSLDKDGKVGASRNLFFRSIK